MSEQSRRSFGDGTRVSLTRKESMGNFDMYVIASFMDDDIHPLELFIKVAKTGSEISGLFDGLALTISIALQYGMQWEVLREKLRHTKFGSVGDKYTSLLDGMCGAMDEIIRKRCESQNKELPAYLTV